MRNSRQRKGTPPSGSDQPKTSRRRLRSSSARCPSSKRRSRQRSDSARKATQWESRCNELEDALDQSARDFETMRAESERVKEAKQALQEAIDVRESELDEKLRARDRQISRLEAQLDKGASRAQKDQEHADELVETMRRPCRLEMMSTVQLLRGRRSASRTSYEKPTRRTLLNLRRLYKERGRRPRHLEGATRPITRGGTRPRKRVTMMRCGRRR